MAAPGSKQTRELIDPQSTIASLFMELRKHMKLYFPRSGIGIINV